MLIWVWGTLLVHGLPDGTVLPSRKVGFVFMGFVVSFLVLRWSEVSQAGLTQRTMADDLEPHDPPPRKECRGAGEGSQLYSGHREAEAGGPGMPYLEPPPPHSFSFVLFFKGKLADVTVQSCSLCKLGTNNRKIWA